MEDNKFYFCSACGSLCCKLEMIYSDNKINYNNVLYYAHEHKQCEEDCDCPLSELQNFSYEICGDYKGLEIKFVLLNKEKYIKIKRNIMYMASESTGYLVDKVLKTKIWFEKFEIKEDMQQFGYKKRIDIPNNNNIITLSDFLEK